MNDGALSKSDPATTANAAVQFSVTKRLTKPRSEKTETFDSKSENLDFSDQGQRAGRPEQDHSTLVVIGHLIGLWLHRRNAGAFSAAAAAYSFDPRGKHYSAYRAHAEDRDSG